MDTRIEVIDKDVGGEAEEGREGGPKDLYKDQKKNISQKRCQVLLKHGKDRRSHLNFQSGNTRLDIYINLSE